MNLADKEIMQMILQIAKNFKALAETENKTVRINTRCINGNEFIVINASLLNDRLPEVVFNTSPLTLQIIDTGLRYMNDQQTALHKILDIKEDLEKRLIIANTNFISSELPEDEMQVTSIQNRIVLINEIIDAILPKKDEGLH